MIGRFYDGRDHSTVCYGIQESKRFAKAIPM
jgi:chromosomal replication initiation ATPase DnaA